jgi:YbbR domain-containing protein
MQIGDSRLESKESIWLFTKQILKKVFYEDWLVKLVALVVTLALWIGVTGLSSPTTERLRGIPLTLRFSSETDITNTPAEEVDIVVSGDERRVRQINKADLVISVDLTDLPPGDRVVQLTPESVTPLDLPPGVKLDEIRPSRIAVRLELVEQKEVEVKVETEGKLPDGYEIYGQDVVPGRVTLRGPASFIRPMSVVPTETIDLSGRTSDFVAEQTPLNPANQKIRVEQAAVDVTFRIGERRMERIFLVPLNDDTGRQATVVLYGPRTALLQTKPEDLAIEIGANEAGVSMPRLILPSGLDGKVEIRKLQIGVIG